MLAFFGADFAADPECRIAADCADAADPAARPVFRRQGEVLAILEAGRRLAQGSADDLAAAAFQLDAEIAFVRAIRAPFEPGDQQPVDGQLIAVALVDRKIERAAAARFPVAVLAQAVIFEGGRRADEEGTGPQLVAAEGGGGEQRAVPVALDGALDRVITLARAEEALSLEADERIAAARRDLEPGL